MAVEAAAGHPALGSWELGVDLVAIFVAEDEPDGVVCAEVDGDVDRLAGGNQVRDVDAGLDGLLAADDDVLSGEDAFDFIERALVAVEVAVFVGDTADQVGIERDAGADSACLLYTSPSPRD